MSNPDIKVTILDGKPKPAEMTCPRCKSPHLLILDMKIGDGKGTGLECLECGELFGIEADGTPWW